MSDYTNDQIVDCILQALYKYDQQCVHISPLCDNFELDEFSYIEFVERLVDEDLAIQCDSPDTLRISPFGRQVSKSGGWLKHIENEAEKIRVIDQKHSNDAKLSKWMVKTRWWPHIVAAISLLLSITALTMQLLNQNRVNRSALTQKLTDSIAEIPAEQPIQIIDSDTLN